MAAWVVLLLPVVMLTTCKSTPAVTIPWGLETRDCGRQGWGLKIYRL